MAFIPFMYCELARVKNYFYVLYFNNINLTAVNMFLYQLDLLLL